MLVCVLTFIAAVGVVLSDYTTVGTVHVEYVCTYVRLTTQLFAIAGCHLGNPMPLWGNRGVAPFWCQGKAGMERREKIQM